MYWYIIHVKFNHGPNLIRFFNQQKDVYAFIPRTEKWYSVKGVKDYVIKDLYPNYIFIKSSLNKKEFNHKFDDFFKTIDGFAEIIEYDEVYALNTNEQNLIERLFDKEGIIKHSVGNIVNSQLIVEYGPLLDLEDLVINIDRHHRIATLKTDLFNKKLLVPLEVISKT